MLHTCCSCSTRVALVSLVQHSCRTYVTHMSLVSHSCRTRVACLALVLHSCHSCHTRVARVWHQSPGLQPSSSGTRPPFSVNVHNISEFLKLKTGWFILCVSDWKCFKVGSKVEKNNSTSPIFLNLLHSPETYLPMEHLQWSFFSKKSWRLKALN